MKWTTDPDRHVWPTTLEAARNQKAPIRVAATMRPVPSRRPHWWRRIAGVVVVASMMTGGATILGGPTGSSAAGWWQPGAIASWAYEIGAGNPPIPVKVGGVSDQVQVVDIDAGNTGVLVLAGYPSRTLAQLLITQLFTRTEVTLFVT